MLINCISDSSHVGPEEETEQKMLKEYIASAMSSLTCREQRVIMHRFGLGGIPRMTLDEIGNAEGVTRERIRQIEKNALKKLGRGKRASKLKDFL